jgi:hypothetical protein
MKVQQPERPRIELNEAMAPQLERKLEEYKARLAEDQNATDDRIYVPPEERTDLIDSEMKIAVLQALLRDKAVDTLALGDELSQKPLWSPRLFDHACFIINAYNQNAPGTVRGGTGLPKA